MSYNTRVTFAIFATPKGKGYGCFAIHRDLESNKYVIASAFCYPQDAKLFSKAQLAKQALKNLADNVKTFTL